MLISGDCAGQLKQFMPFRAMYSWVDLGLVRLTGALSSWKKISTPREISSYHWTQVLFHNVLILFSINVSIYRCNRSNTIPRNTTQYHQYLGCDIRGRTRYGLQPSFLLRQIYYELAGHAQSLFCSHQKILLYSSYFELSSAFFHASLFRRLTSFTTSFFLLAHLFM